MSKVASALEKSAPRHEILYARVKPINKEFVESLMGRGEKKRSLSVVVDGLLDELREGHGNDRQRSKSGKRARAS